MIDVNNLIIIRPCVVSDTRGGNTDVGSGSHVRRCSCMTQLVSRDYKLDRKWRDVSRDLVSQTA